MIDGRPSTSSGGAGWRLLQLALVAAAALMACIITIAALTTTRAVALAVAGGIVMSGIMILCGNLRLFCLCGLILTAPLSFSKAFRPVPHMGGASAFFIEIADVFLFGLLILLLRDYLVGWRRDRLRLPPLTFLWCGLILLGMISVLVGPYRTSASHEVFQMLKHLVLFLVLIHELVRRRQILHVAVALMCSVLLQACIGFVQFATDRPLGLEVLGEASEESLRLLAAGTLRGGDWVHRIGALLGHANTFSVFLAALLPIGIALLFTRIRPMIRLICTAAVLLGGCALVLTLSRSGWVSFAVSFAVVMILSLLNREMNQRFLLAKAGVIAILSIIMIAMSGRILERVYGSDPMAVQVRWEWIDVAGRMVRDNPVLGVGLNTFVFQMVPYTDLGSPQALTERYGEHWPVVHNIYMLVWAEQGTIGLLLYLSLTLTVVWVGIRNLKVRDHVLFAINIGALGGFCAILVDGLASFFPRFPNCGRIFWILIALMVAIHYWRKLNEPPASKTPASGGSPTDMPSSLSESPQGPHRSWIMPREN